MAAEAEAAREARAKVRNSVGVIVPRVGSAEASVR